MHGRKLVVAVREPVDLLREQVVGIVLWGGNTRHHGAALDVVKPRDVVAPEACHHWAARAVLARYRRVQPAEPAGDREPLRF